MYLSSMRIQNYRNFKDITMTFHPLANYLVGENDIGKSGFLRLLSYMANAWTCRKTTMTIPNSPSGSPWISICSRARMNTLPTPPRTIRKKSGYGWK